MRKIIYAPNLRDIKTIHSAGMRSIPKAQRSSYLDLFILSKEKERLEKESFMLGKRTSSLDKQLGILNNRIEKLQKEILKEQRGKIQKGAAASSLKRMAIRY